MEIDGGVDHHDPVEAATTTPQGAIRWTTHTETRGGPSPITITSPRFVTSDGAADGAIRRDLDAAIGQQARSFLSDVNESPRCHAPDEPSGLCAMPIDCAVASARSRGVSVRCDATPYLGGAHPTKLVFTLTFVIDPKGGARRVRLADLATSPSAKREILTKAFAQLDAEHGEGLSEIVSSSVMTAKDVPFTVQGAADGAPKLCVIFDDLPFAIGPRDGCLDTRELGDLVRPDVIAAFH